jgi:hypothetical protein
MTTYDFVDKNGSAVIILTANTEKEAMEYLDAIGKNQISWRLSDTHEEDD